MNTARQMSKLLTVLLAAALLGACGDDAVESTQRAASQVAPAPVQEQKPAPMAASIPVQSAETANVTEPVSTESAAAAAPDEATESTGHDALTPAPDTKVTEQRGDTATHAAPPATDESTAESTAVVTPTAEQVRRIQQNLRDSGFDPGAVDGLMGRRTRAALQQFQQHNGLEAGVITEQTLSALQRSAEDHIAQTRAGTMTR